MNQVLRSEKKYILTLDEYKEYNEYFSKILVKDKHTGKDGYCIRSLYFDTMADKDYGEKIDGVETRKKIRLRIYSPDNEFAMLEMKQKQGDSQRKRSLRISREDAKQLIRGNYGILLKYKEKFAAECYAVMNLQFYKPKAIIEYIREAYVASENNTRVTFDREIKATESCFDLYSPSLLMNSVFDNFNVILEIKYNHFLLSYIKEIVSRCDRIQTSASKYCMGRLSLFW